jgi:hypothetical protein
VVTDSRLGILDLRLMKEVCVSVRRVPDRKAWQPRVSMPFVRVLYGTTYL